MWLCTIGSGACGDAHVAAKVAPAVERAWVTGAAARALEPGGTLRLAAPELDPNAEIDATRAAELAAAYVKAFGWSLQAMYEEHHRGAVDVERARRCGRTLYAASQYEILPASAPGYVRNRYAPFWLVSFCNGDVPVISVAVSSLSTRMTITDGHIRGEVGNDFRSSGIPRSTSAVPITPEEAVHIAFATTGRRVSEVPRLVLPPLPGSPQVAKWHVVLEGPVEVKGRESGRVLRTRELWVGYARTWHERAIHIPNVSAPVELEGIGKDSTGTEVRIPLTVKPGAPTALERAEATPRVSSSP